MFLIMKVACRDPAAPKEQLLKIRGDIEENESTKKLLDQLNSPPVVPNHAHAETPANAAQARN
jgi:hypothetical protein